MTHKPSAAPKPKRKVAAISPAPSFSSLALQISAYCDRRVIILFLLGLSSGLPFILVLSTLSMWLIESGLSKAAIGSFMMVSLPYSGKFLWASCVDHYPIPWLSRRLGQRRSWMMISQLGTMLGLVWLGHTEPAVSPWLTAVAACFVSLFSATQDIAAEAYRAEVLDTRILGAGAGMNGFGYRLGMLVGGAGALYLSTVLSWGQVYNTMALCMVAGMLAVLMARETLQAILPGQEIVSDDTNLTFMGRLQSFSAIAFAFLRQPLAWVVLVFIFFFKMISTVMIVMTPVFLTDLGFDKIEIANIAKLFGIVAMMVGGVAAGLIITLMGMRASLWVCLGIKGLAGLCFMIQAGLGYVPSFAMVTMGVEHIASGMGTTVLVAYLSGLCRDGYSGMDFALLSSFGSLCRVISSVLGGWLAHGLSWLPFFAIVTGLLVPCFVLLGFYGHIFIYWNRKPDLQALDHGSPHKI